MKIDELNILHKKAENRNDGVYYYKGNLWAVKSKRFIAYIDNMGQVLQRFGSFNMVIGDMSETPHYERRGKLLEWLRKQ